MSLLRDWLEGKHANGVKQVRIVSVLGKLDESDKASRTPRRRSKTGQSNNGNVPVKPEDLLGAAEVAELLGVDRTRPSKWLMKHKPDGSPRQPTTFGPDKIPFPEPFAKLDAGPVWLRSQIEPFIPLVEERRRPRN